MTDPELQVLRFGTWVQDSEAARFLKTLGLEVASIGTDWDSLKSIVNSFVTRLPFHNLFLLTRPPQSPTAIEIRDDMMRLQGGPCGTMNPFLGALLDSLGYEVTLVAASMMEPNCHLGLLVRIGDERYYVDVGDGKPYFQPMRIGTSEVINVPSHQFRYQTVNNELLLDYRDSSGNWETTCTVHLVPRHFGYFQDSIFKHYSLEDYGPFSRNFRLVCYPGQAILGFRNLVYLHEMDGRCMRDPLPDWQSLENLAIRHFGNLGLPISEAIHKLKKKGVW